MKVVVDFTNKQVKGSSPKIEEKATLQGGFSKVISMFRYVINNKPYQKLSTMITHLLVF